MAKVYVFFADGMEEIEALAQVDILRRAGIDIESVSIMGRIQILGAHGIEIKADRLFSDELTDADMIILPGGSTGTKHLMNHEGLNLLIEHYYKEQKYLAAICAAPGVYGVKNLLRGRRAICYPGHEGNLPGAIIIDEKVVIDGNFITSKGMGTSIDFALALIELLCGTKTMETIQKGLQYER